MIQLYRISLTSRYDAVGKEFVGDALALLA